MSYRVSENDISITEREAYVDWDKYCVHSLEKAKEIIRSKTSQRYDGPETAIVESVRVIRGLGYGKFVVLVGLLVAGGIALVAGITALLVMSLALLPVAIGAAALGGATIRTVARKLYTHRELVIKIKDILDPYKGQFKELQPGAYPANQLKIDDLFIKCVLKVISHLFEVEILLDDTSLPFKPICLCGNVLHPKIAADCYVDGLVKCNLCNRRINGGHDVFHCEQTVPEVHRRGYNICIQCARKNKNRLGRYSALIIQTLPENAPDCSCRDSEELTTMFERLNYHRVEKLKSTDVTKDSIQQKLKQLKSDGKSNEVIVVCFSGHGAFDVNTSSFTFYSHDEQPLISDKEIYASLIIENPMEYGVNGLVDESTCDLLILMNACNSGGFQVEHVARELNNAEILDLFNIPSDMKDNLLTTLQTNTSSSSQPQQINQSINKLLERFHDISYGAVVISSCGAHQLSYFTGAATNHISPFFLLILEFFKETEQEIPKKTSSDLYEYIRQQSSIRSFSDVVIMEQHANRPVQNGSFDGVDLCPAVKADPFQRTVQRSSTITQISTAPITTTTTTTVPIPLGKSKHEDNYPKKSALHKFQEDMKNLRKEVGGNVGVPFVDLTDINGYKRVIWSTNAPKWRIAIHGINLEGFCSNNKCKAYDKHVIIGIGMKEFDVIGDTDSSTCKCPMCKQYVEPTTCGFNNCYWRWKGLKQLPQQPPMRCSDDWKAADDAYHYFDQTLKGTATTSGTAIWRKLILEAKPRKN